MQQCLQTAQLTTSVFGACSVEIGLKYMQHRFADWLFNLSHTTSSLVALSQVYNLSQRQSGQKLSSEIAADLSHVKLTHLILECPETAGCSLHLLQPTGQDGGFQEGLHPRSTSKAGEGSAQRVCLPASAS